MVIGQLQYVSDELGDRLARCGRASGCRSRSGSGCGRRCGLRAMLERQEDVFYYLTVMNENYVHSSMPASATAVRSGRAGSRRILIGPSGRRSYRE